VFQKKPGPDLVEDGLDPDLLGLFVGDDYAREGGDPLPSEILLFLANIMEEAEGDWDRYRQEVRTTLLHEIGHYLGLDEEGLFERNLE
jgi:predicted Zn-dependent protease with MMP-like domain